MKVPFFILPEISLALTYDSSILQNIKTLLHSKTEKFTPFPFLSFVYSCIFNNHLRAGFSSLFLPFDS